LGLMCRMSLPMNLNNGRVRNIFSLVVTSIYQNVTLLFSKRGFFKVTKRKNDMKMREKIKRMLKKNF